MKMKKYICQLFKFFLLAIIFLMDILIILYLLNFEVPSPLEGYKLKVESPIISDVNLIIDNSKTIISSKILNEVRGQNMNLKISYNDHQIIINGKDIINTEDFDAKLVLKVINENNKVDDKIQKGIIFKFDKSGVLPGKMLIRLKATKEIKSILDDTVYVYMSNENNKYMSISNNTSLTIDGYFEFSIFQNEEYILLDEKLDDSLIKKEIPKTVTFQKSNKIHLLLITLSMIAIISTFIFTFRIKMIKNIRKML